MGEFYFLFSPLFAVVYLHSPQDPRALFALPTPKEGHFHIILAPKIRVCVCFFPALSHLLYAPPPSPSVL